MKKLRIRSVLCHIKLSISLLLYMQQKRYRFDAFRYITDQVAPFSKPHVMHDVITD